MTSPYMKYPTLLFIVISMLYVKLGKAQNMNHKVFLLKMENSSENTYRECLQQYDKYLSQYPNDILIKIQRCEFINNAQYDDYDDYNPNQLQFDSCLIDLKTKHSENSDVIIYQTTHSWGDNLLELFDEAENSISKNPYSWSDKNLSELYMKMSKHYYRNEEYEKAYTKALEAIKFDPPVRYSLDFAKTLIEVDKNDEALEVLLAEEDTSKIAWILNQKANLLLELEAYNEALDLYNKINEIDSTFNNNLEIAKILEEVGAHAFARTYLLKDTAQSWNAAQSVQDLYLHDLAFQDGDTAKESYDALRDFGYSFDPLGLYRWKLFLKDPSQGWKFRDVLGILSLIALLVVIILLPSIWILPIYFIGIHWKYKYKPKTVLTQWGLKTFWFISSVYLLASVIATFVDIDLVHSYFNSSIFVEELSTDDLGLTTLLFISICALGGLITLFNKPLKFLLSNKWSIMQSLLMAVALLAAFKVGSGMYIKIGMSVFDLSIEDITGWSKILLSSKEEIKSIAETYGIWIAILTIGIIVPIYEEIVFRGVIYDACTKYINFKSANVIQAIFFGAVHLDLFLFPVFFAFGIITGILRRESGGLLSGIVFHSINNIIAIWAILLL